MIYVIFSFIIHHMDFFMKISFIQKVIEEKNISILLFRELFIYLKINNLF